MGVVAKVLFGSYYLHITLSYS